MVTFTNFQNLKMQMIQYSITMGEAVKCKKKNGRYLLCTNYHGSPTSELLKRQWLHTYTKHEHVCSHTSHSYSKNFFTFINFYMKKKQCICKLEHSYATQDTSFIAFSILGEKLFTLKFSVHKERIAGVQVDIDRL